MSCTDCASNEIKYAGDGSQVLYTFPFTYLTETDVKVSLWDETTRRWNDTTAWTFSNATTVQFNTAPAAPGADDVEQFNVKISRCTDIDPLAASFYPGSAIRAQDLNDNFEQLQMAIQEGRCLVPDWLFDFLDSYYWNKQEETTYTTDVWVDETDNDHVPTTGAVQQELAERWDKRTETTYIADDWASEADDSHVPTTGAVDQFVDAQILDNFDTRRVTETQQETNGGSGLIDDDHHFTTAASAARHDTYHQDTTPAAKTYEQPGKYWFDTATLADYIWDANADVWVKMENTGPTGPEGPQGDPATVNAGTTTTGAAGTNASVSNSGTTTDAIFDFVIPRGDKGDQGDSVTGPQGDAATVDVGTTTTIAPGSPAEVTNSGSTSEAVFDFRIPRGEQGERGDDGTAAPIASASVLGLIRVGQNLQIDSGTGVLDAVIPAGLEFEGTWSDTNNAPTITRTGTISPGDFWIWDGGDDVTLNGASWGAIDGETISDRDRVVWSAQDDWAFVRDSVGSGGGSSGVTEVTGTLPIVIGGSAARPDVSININNLTELP